MTCSYNKLVYLFTHQLFIKLDRGIKWCAKRLNLGTSVLQHHNEVGRMINKLTRFGKIVSYARKQK